MLACPQVRKRDKFKKVIVEEKKYYYVDTSSSSAASLDLDSEVQDSFQPSPSDYGSSMGSDSSDEFSWVQRLQHIPDKVCRIFRGS